MALEGQLSDFNLAEILQLIAGQQKTGFLVLQSNQEIVFVFEKGTLISTRDRRTEGDDPLERYLTAYGFFDRVQWKHIDFIRRNSSLDLTEILLSERIMDEENLEQVLKSLAVELTHHCLKLKRGRYHFTATKEKPKGVRGRIKMNVQGLLMEAARRQDEETRLAEIFPSGAVTFQRGEQSWGPEDVDPGGIHLLKLALAGEPLAQIICQGMQASFTVREQLREFCEKGYLKPVTTAVAQEPGAGETPAGKKGKSGPGLRSVPLTILGILLLAGVGYLRWQPLFQSDQSWGLAETTAVTAEAGVDPGSAPPLPLPDPNRSFRLRQIRDSICEAVELFRYRHHRYPVDISLLVKENFLPAATYRTYLTLGWTYRLLDSGEGYSLGG